MATAAFGHAISGPWDEARQAEGGEVRRGPGRCRAWRPWSIPTGSDLYRHVGHLLVSSGVTGLIEEYQSAPFGKPRPGCWRWPCWPWSRLPALVGRRIDRYQLAHVLVWLHLALTSIRNAPLFALAAAPALAGADRRPAALVPSDLDRAGPQVGLVPRSAVGVALPGRRRGPARRVQTRDQWPLAALADAEPAAGSVAALPRAGLGRPDRGRMQADPAGTYLDDRFELFGKEAILEYVDALAGGPAWDTIRDRDRIDLVWVRPDRGLAETAAEGPGVERPPSGQGLGAVRRSRSLCRPPATCARPYGSSGSSRDSSQLTFVPREEVGLDLAMVARRTSSRSDDWPRASP